MHYFQFHVADYKSHTGHLTIIEDLAYRRLLDWYYLHERPISSDPIHAARLIVMPDYAKEVEQVLGEFFTSTDAGWINKRADKEIAVYQGFSTSGKRGAAIRWGKGDNSHPIAPPIATMNHEPLTINQEEAKASLSSLRTPSQLLLDKFHEKCQLLPKVTVFNEPRKLTLKARFKEVMVSEKWDADQTCDWFGTFYGIVNDSKFLTGRAPPGRDGRAFQADWDWIHGPKNFVKIVEGKYSGE